MIITKIIIMIKTLNLKEEDDDDDNNEIIMNQ